MLLFEHSCTYDKINTHQKFIIRLLELNRVGITSEKFELIKRQSTIVVDNYYGKYLKSFNIVN